MIVGAIAALTLKSAPNSTIGVTQTTISSGVAGAAPAPAPQASSSNSNARTVSASDTATTTTVKASSGSLTTIPAGAVIVPAPTGHESGEGNEVNEHPVTATTVKSGTLLRLSQARHRAVMKDLANAINNVRAIIAPIVFK